MPLGIDGISASRLLPAPFRSDIATSASSRDGSAMTSRDRGPSGSWHAAAAHKRSAFAAALAPTGPTPPCPPGLLILDLAVRGAARASA